MSSTSLDFKIPSHIAIILDGNGRWATSRGKDRSVGHWKGIGRIKPMIKRGGERGVKVMTFFLFSTENWSRPQTEVDALMAFCIAFLEEHTPWMVESNFSFKHIGRRQPIPPDVFEALQKAERATAQNTGLRVQLAFNYGARSEIVDAARAIGEKIKYGLLSPQDVTEQTVSSHLYTSNIVDPDLWVRTAGEMRLSNFLLWQISYAELYVTQTLCPDFTPEDLDEAIVAYGQRTRKFGRAK